jgi:predicted nucleotidyltransferase
MKKLDIIQTLRLFKKENQNTYGIRSIGIFGSAARDSLVEQSDIDVVVELEDPDLFNLIGIKQDLEERFHCTVDVIRYRNGMNRFLKHRIDQEAVYA